MKTAILLPAALAVFGLAQPNPNCSGNDKINVFVATDYNRLGDTSNPEICNRQCFNFTGVFNNSISSIDANAPNGGVPLACTLFDLPNCNFAGSTVTINADPVNDLRLLQPNLDNLTSSIFCQWCNVGQICTT